MHYSLSMKCGLYIPINPISTLKRLLLSMWCAEALCIHSVPASQEFKMGSAEDLGPPDSRWWLFTKKFRGLKWCALAAGFFNHIKVFLVISAQTSLFIFNTHTFTHIGRSKI